MDIRRAIKEDVAVLSQLLIEAYTVTYQQLLAPEVIKKDIQHFYHPNRLLEEVVPRLPEWSGYYALEVDGKMKGAIGGGLVNEQESEVFVLYLDPEEKGQGYGSALLEELTKVCLQLGAKKQWVSVVKGNQLGIPFYEARGFCLQHEAPAYTHEESGQMALRYMRMIPWQKQA